MTVPHRILVPYDFSTGAKQALRYATDLAKALPRAEIVLMHALEPMIPVGPAVLQEIEFSQPGSREALEDGLDKLARKTKSATKLPVRTIIRRGRAFREILGAAKDTRADLIVMGNTGYDSQHSSVFGSTAERVARKSSCPLLLVGEKGKTLS